MYRVSVTTLEKFRRYMAGTSSYDTEESLIESIKGIFLGNDKTIFGSAFHKIIEGEYERKANRVLADNVSFTKVQAQVAFDYKKRHKLMVHEISIRKEFSTNYFPIQVSARVDGTEGLNVHDTKTKFRSIDLQEYADSCQWKFYLNMLEADAFYYDLFEVKGFVELGRLPYKIPDEVIIIPHEPFQCIRYESMNDEIHSLLNSFLDYLHNRNFVHLLKPAIEEPEFNF